MVFPENVIFTGKLQKIPSGRSKSPDEERQTGIPVR